MGGADFTSAIVPGVSAKSLMFNAAGGIKHGLHMPPHDECENYPPLSSQELDILKQWIDDGTVWPQGVKLSPS